MLLLPLIGDDDEEVQEAAAGCVNNLRKIALANDMHRTRKGGGRVLLLLLLLLFSLFLLLLFLLLFLSVLMEVVMVVVVVGVVLVVVVVVGFFPFLFWFVFLFLLIFFSVFFSFFFWLVLSFFCWCCCFLDGVTIFVDAFFVVKNGRIIFNVRHILNFHPQITANRADKDIRI